MGTKVKKQYVFREFLHKDMDTRRKSILKNFRNVRLKFMKQYDLDPLHIDTLLWAYDMEFFTWRYAAKQMKIRENNFYNRCIVQLQQKELLFHYFDRYRAHKTFEDAMFREDGWNAYKVRFTLTQKARNIVDKLYKELQNVE